MAVYTEVPQSTLEAFLENFRLGKAVSFEGIEQGIENSNYRLETTEGLFILTLYERRVDEADLPFFQSLTEHLAKKGIPCPAALPDKNGKTLHRLCGRPAALLPFMSGEWPRAVTTDHCRKLGAILAKLHLATADFEQSRANRLSVMDWRPLLEKSRKTAQRLEPGLSAAMMVELVEIETHWPNDLPSGIIHADLFPDNVFFEDGRISGLLDFTFACMDLLAYDLAICINAWCFEKNTGLNREKTQALLAGYEAVRPLSPEERKALPLLCRAAAMRFFATRLFDWVNTPDGPITWRKDPLQCWAQSLAHRELAGKFVGKSYL